MQRIDISLRTNAADLRLVHRLRVVEAWLATFPVHTILSVN